jgi:hypothetical protein
LTNRRQVVEGEEEDEEGAEAKEKENRVCTFVDVQCDGMNKNVSFCVYMGTMQPTC